MDNKSMKLDLNNYVEYRNNTNKPLIIHFENDKNGVAIPQINPKEH